MIILAVLVNACLLALLFMMAVNSDDDHAPSQESQVIVEAQPNVETAIAQEGTSMSNPTMQPVDEGDHALQEFQMAPQPLPVIPDDSMQPQQDMPPEGNMEPQSAPVESPVSQAPQPEEAETPKIVKVTVKKGDSLDKIARANGTTIKAIKAENKLKNDRLDIGQVLNVPVGSKKAKAKASPSKEVADNTAAPSGDAEYYTIKKGDNPWKIAKKNHIKVSDFLKLNNLDEEKARNLKAGDKVRIK